MLETMRDFFNHRLDGYEEHQLGVIQGAREFYPLTAAYLPQKENARLLDLGCGTGLELEPYLASHPTAEVTGIDLAEEMLKAFRMKFPD